MKKLREIFQFKKSEELLVVSGEKQAEKKKGLPLGQYFYYTSILFFLLMIVFSYLFTFDLLEKKERGLMEITELLEQKELVMRDLDALRELTTEVDSVKERQALTKKAISLGPRYDRVISFIEEKINEIKREHYIELPENISWRKVSESDLVNRDLEGLGIYQYALGLEGSYEGVLEFFRVLRSSIRFMDVVSINSFRGDLEGRVKLDMSFWAYNSDIADDGSARFVQTDSEVLEAVIGRLTEQENLPESVERAVEKDNFGRDELFFTNKEEINPDEHENI